MDPAFEKAVERFRGGLTKSQQDQFTGCKKQDVEKIIQEIQSRHGAQKRLKYMRRVSKFIEAMSQLGEVIEVFLNVHNSVAFVWGPIKFILVVASTWVETLDLLLETYADIGEALPGLAQYSALYKKYPSIQNHLENYYLDVLEFNKNALEVFARPGWKSVFHSSWRTFKSQFGPIISNFKRHRQLLTDEKMTALMSEMQDLRHLAEEKLDSLESEINARHAKEVEKEVAELEEARHRQRRIVQRKLDAPDSLKDHEHACSMRQLSTAGDWILRNSKFQEWVELDTFSSKRFYLSGIPGAGKTILASRIIDHLKDLQAKSKNQGHCFPIVYFYFKHLHENKRQMVHLLSSLLAQLAEEDGSLLDLFYREFSSLDQQKVSLPKLCELASTALRAQRRCFVVVDGLDECSQDPHDGTTSEAVKVIKWFEELMVPKEGILQDTDETCIRLLISGQRDGHIDRTLESVPSIQLEVAAGHGEDISSYAGEQARTLCRQFSAPVDVEQDIIHKVVTRAKGMFLYAKIVLDNLSDQVSKFDFEAELKAENFPEGLEKAYERVVKRVLKNPVKPERLAAEQILGWVISAERPLRWREIQSRFCIDPENGNANVQKKPLKTCKHLCGSLVEVETAGGLGGLGGLESESEVEMVHPSAKAYLIETGSLCLATEHAKMALFCTQYLTSFPFCTSTERDIQTSALSGYYGFHDYAASFWWHHVNETIEARKKIHLETLHNALQSTKKILRAYQTTGNAFQDDVQEVEMIIRQFRQLPSHSRDRQKVLDIEISTTAVRDVIEALHCGESQTNPVPLYGPVRYKCPKDWCQLFATGFLRAEQRKDHLNEHDRPYHCTTEGCYLADVGFPNESGLNQHMKRHHAQPENDLFPKSTRSAKKETIWTAIESGNLSSVKDLVTAAPSIINKVKRTAEGMQSPILSAIQLGHLNICEYLLEKGANLTSGHHFGIRSVLHEAVRIDDLEIVVLLLMQEKLVFIRQGLLTVLELAAFLGHHRLFASFKSKRPQEFDLMPSMIQAIKRNHIRSIQELLRLKGDDLGASAPLPPHDFMNCLYSASDNVLRLLIPVDWEYSGMVEGSRCTILHEACRWGDRYIQLVYRLISVGGNLSRQDHQGRTPLEVAAMAGSRELVSAILTSATRIGGSDEGQKFTLEQLSRYDPQVAEVFLEEGRSGAFCSGPGGSILHSAIYAANTGLVRLLLRSNYELDLNAGLENCPDSWSVLLNTKEDSATLTPLTMALACLDLSERKKSTDNIPDCWDVERFKTIATSLIVNEDVDLSYLDNSKSVTCFKLAMELEEAGLTLSLFKRGMFGSLGSGNGERNSRLVKVLEENIDTLVAVKGDERRLRDTVTTLAKWTQS